MTAAIGVGVSLSVLGAVGYAPNTPQNESVLLTLRILYALVPSICNLVAIAIALYYPISGEVHASIRSAIVRKQTGQAVADPLTAANSAA
jgi:GPH family glycoside/pentoside/hexuronide:cation symporter